MEPKQEELFASRTPMPWIQRVRDGRHPTGRDLMPSLEKCGGCGHALSTDKSGLTCVEDPHDKREVRVGWRACVLFAGGKQ